MRNKKTYITLAALAVIMLLCMAWVSASKKTAAENGKGSSADLPVLSEADYASNNIELLSAEDYKAVKEQYEQTAFSASDLLGQESAAACDQSSASIFIPCDVQKLTNGGQYDGERFVTEILSGLHPNDPDISIYVCADQMMDSPAEAVSAGYPFEAFLAAGEKAESFQIILTGLPVICIEKTDSDEIRYKEEHAGRIRYIPLSASRAETESFCRFHVRGNVSSTLDKKPYKVTLTDKAGNKIRASVGGMREDDDWILNPLFTDFSRVREMTAYTLWEEISAFSQVPQASSRMQYAELFLDNAYQGIYGLMEPVDGKQLSLAEGDLLYKIDRWDREYPYIDEYEKKEGETEICNDSGLPCVEIRYPVNWDRTATWKPMQAFHNFVYRTEDLQTLADAGLQTDLDSVVTLSLFTALTHAMDNNWKNSLLIARHSGGGYTLYRTIWDLNYVFGDVFVYEPEEGYTAFDPDTAFVYTPLQDSTYDFEAYLAADPSLEESLRRKWAAWRDGGISADSVCAEAVSNMTLLTSSGALAREMECWPQEKGADRALEEMEEWIRDRFAYLDEQFGWNTK